jgi:hypothetical protein
LTFEWQGIHVGEALDSLRADIKTLLLRLHASKTKPPSAGLARTDVVDVLTVSGTYPHISLTPHLVIPEPTKFIENYRKPMKCNESK